MELPNGSGHAVAGIGHSSDFTITLPSDRIGWSYEYSNGLIVNDDNLPPYRSVPIDSRTDRDTDTDYILDNVDSFVVPLYEKIYLEAENVFCIVESIVSDEQIGLSTLRPPGLSPDDLVIRLFLTSSRSWKRDRRGSQMPNDLGLLYSAMPMPRFIWVAELSTRALYPDRQVLGEIIIDATASFRDNFAFLSIHYPGILILNDRHSLSESLKSRASALDISLHSAYRLYRNNLEEIRRDQE